MTDAIDLVEAIRAEHTAGGDPGDQHCALCVGCDAARLLVLVDEMTATIAATTAERQEARELADQLNSVAGLLRRENDALAQRVAAAQRVFVSAIEGIVPNPCPCSDEEFCGECGVVKLAESAYVALAPAAAAEESAARHERGEQP